MPVVGGADRDSINSGMLKQFAKVAEGLYGRMVLPFLFLVVALHEVLSVSETARINVAHGDHAPDVMLEDSGHIHLMRDASAPDLTDLNSFARRVLAEHRGRNNRGKTGDACGGCQRSAEELPSRNGPGC